jgi:hypothetical protein
MFLAVLIALPIALQTPSLQQRFEDKLAQSNAKLSQATSEQERFYALPNAALWNAQLGSRADALSYAKELLALLPRYTQNWNYGNAIHKAHLALGLVAVANRDLMAAKTEILEAGRTPGSPQLNSFGPNMLLAQKLLEAGERDTVLEYFKLCAVFWKNDHGKVGQWSSQIQSGLQVNFGANLFY